LTVALNVDALILIQSQAVQALGEMQPPRPSPSPQYALTAFANCLSVYNGKREGDWPCHHQGELRIDRFYAEETLSEI